ncbi:MAG TPA: hypothetical protein VF141_06865, partial [Chryseolinea sp.]
MRRIKILSAFCFLYFTLSAQPPPRHLERIAFDSGRNKLIMFGGASMINNQLTYFSDVYEWDPAGWVEIKTEGPGPRNAAPLVYDPIRKSTLLFGGVFENADGFKIYFDVWSWDGKEWKLINSKCPVKEPMAVYDTGNKRVLVYGEVTNKRSLTNEGPREFELWEFKDDSWKKLSTDGPDVHSTLSFNESRNALIITSLEDDPVTVWEWTNEEWKRVSCTSNCPEKRSREAVAYHPGLKATCMFGGRDSER